MVSPNTADVDGADGAKARAVFRDFFAVSDSPFNLAIFRMVLFLFVIVHFDYAQVVWFSRLPPDLMFPPVGMKGLLSWVPVNPAWASAASFLFLAFCFLSLIGWRARTSCFLAAVTGFYVLGIPQFFGKVNHDHHVIWCMLILSACPCADVWSVDAVGQAIGEADRGNTAPIPKSPRYALPLRFVWLLMALAYFFPGFWKLADAPLLWTWSDNLKYQLYARWSELDGWLPFFRLDQYPLLYKSGAAATVCFELTFFVLVLFPRLRWLALVSGLLFHGLTGLFMKIPFLSLQICYASLVDWSRILTGAGRRLFREPLHFRYDGNSRAWRRTVAACQRFDVLERVVYLNTLDVSATAKRSRSSSGDPLPDVQAVIGERTWVGIEACRKMAWRIPVLWPFGALLWVPPIVRAGKAVCRRMAELSSSTDSTSSRKRFRVPMTLPGPRFLKLVGCALLIGNLAFGFMRIVSGWPLACYPTFARVIREPRKDTLYSYGMLGDEEKPIPFDRLHRCLPAERFGGLFRSILGVKDKQVKERKLKALMDLMAAEGIDLSEYSAVRFYRATCSTEPGRGGDALISRTLEAEISWHPVKTVVAATDEHR